MNPRETEENKTKENERPAQKHYGKEKEIKKKISEISLQASLVEEHLSSLDSTQRAQDQTQILPERGGGWIAWPFLAVAAFNCESPLGVVCVALF